VDLCLIVNGVGFGRASLFGFRSLNSLSVAVEREAEDLFPTTQRAVDQDLVLAFERCDVTNFCCWCVIS